jgi:hypothetical protein
MTGVWGQKEESEAVIPHKEESLLRQSSMVNRMWSYVNELSHQSICERNTFLSACDLHSYTKGAGKLLGLHRQAEQVVSKEYVTRRKQF